jgi:hypothetical protein
MFGPELFLSGPSAVDQALCASHRSAEGLIPIASNAVDILLCYLQGKAHPSHLAVQTVRAALEIYADALPQAGALQNALEALSQHSLGIPVAHRRSKAKGIKSEPAAHLLRAIASGVSYDQLTEDADQLQRDLCLQLHLCNFIQSVRTLSLLFYLARQNDTRWSDSSQLFLKQAAEYLRHIVRNAEAADLTWEYKLYLFALGRT